MIRPSTAVRVGELAAVLAQYGEVLCAPTVERDEDGVPLLTVRLECGLQAASLGHELQYLQGVAQVRSFAQDYGISSTEIDRLLLMAAEQVKERT